MLNVGLHILIVTGIFPPDIGGPASYVPVIAEKLYKRGHKVIVVTLSDSIDQNDKSFPFQVLRIRRNIFKPWRWLCTILILIRVGLKADVMYVNGLALESSLANIILRRPLVLKIVGDWAWERASNLGWVADNFEVFQKTRYQKKVQILKALRSWWTRRADIIIVPSQYLGKWVSKWGTPKEKLVVIYNAVGSLKAIHAVEVPLAFSVNVVTAGRLVPWKQIDKVIEAITRLEDVGLVIIGDGPHKEHLKKITRVLGATSKVHFAGQKSSEDTMALMAACDLFVLNSTYEGLPHVVLEAMGLGLPVVATDVGGTPEVIRDGLNGLLVPPLDDEALSWAISKLLFSPEARQRLGDAARRSIGRFTFDQMFEETEAILQSASLTAV
jgi:glycosyltransferase involved in cell wall biosynthesis